MRQGFSFADPTVVLGSPAAGRGGRSPTSGSRRRWRCSTATGWWPARPAPARPRRCRSSRASSPTRACPASSPTSRVTSPGIAEPGDPANPKVQERAAQLGWTFTPKGHPVEFLSLSGKLGAQVRATVHSFGAGPARQGHGPQRDADVGPVAGLQVLRRQPAAAAGPGRPAHHAAVPGLRRGEGGARGLRRHVARPRSACCCARS